MPEEKQETVTEMLLTRVLRKQDEIDARLLKIEATLGIKAAAGTANDVAIATAAAAATAAATVATTVTAAVADIAAATVTEIVAATATLPVATTATDTGAAAPEAVKAAAARPAALSAARAVVEVGKPPTLESRVGLAWLNRIGVVTLILGVAFAFKTAVDNNWLGPTARVVLGVVGALVTLVAGDILWQRRQAVFAQGLTGLGLALLYLSFWASFALYHVLPQPLVFGLMVGTTVASAMLAIRYNGQAIAVLAMFGGYVTPVVLSSGEPHPLIFLGYLTLLNVGGFALSRKRNWPVLEYFAAVATGVLYAGWLSAGFRIEDRPIASVFAVVFYAQFSSARPRLLWQFAQVLGPVVVANLWSDQHVLLPLLLVFAVGGLVVAEVRRWQEAPLWALCWYWAPYLGSIFLRAASPSPALELGHLTIGFALFYGWLLWWNVRQKRALHGAAVAVLAGNPAAYFAASYLLLDPTYHAYMGLFAVALAAAHLALAKLLWDPGATPVRDPRPGMLALGVALTCFTLAVPIQLGGFTITIAWALEGAALAWLSARYENDKASIAACIVLVLAAMRLVDDKIYEPAAQMATLANLRFVTFAVMAASLFASARFLRERPRKTAAYVVGHVVVLIAVGLEIAGWVERSYEVAERFEIGTVAISIMMAIYAVMLVVLGVVRRNALDRILGLFLMGIVVLKLYLSDVWSLGRAFRITAFLGLGVLLLLVSYLYSRYRSVIERLWKDT